MKKIIIVFVVFLSFYLNVYAEIYYGEYERIEGIHNISDEIKKEEIKVFNTYNKEYIDMGYFENSNDYIKNELDFIEISGYNENDFEYLNIGLENKTVNSIRFNNIKSRTKFYDLKIYYEGELINYTVTFNSMKSITDICDNNLNTYAESLNNSAYMKFNLFKQYDIDKLSIVMISKNDYYDNYLSINSNNAYDMPINITNNKTVITFSKNKSDIEKYNTIKKIYKYYKEEKIPTNIYKENGDNLILDDFKFEERYYKRDKLVLNDELIIDNYNKNINDLIIYNSNKVENICNYDLYKNGIYECTFILNDINIKKNIIVNIPENEPIISIEDNNIEADTKKELNIPKKDKVEESKIEEIKVSDSKDKNNLKEKNKNDNNITSSSKNNNINKNSSSIRPKNNSVNNIEKIENNNSNLKNIKNDTNTKMNDNNAKYNKKESNNKSKIKDILLKIIKYFIFILMISIEIIIYIRKKRKRHFVENV